jgi:hypothetical protein
VYAASGQSPTESYWSGFASIFETRTLLFWDRTELVWSQNVDCLVFFIVDYEKNKKIIREAVRAYLANPIYTLTPTVSLNCRWKNEVFPWPICFTKKRCMPSKVMRWKSITCCSLAFSNPDSRESIGNRIHFSWHPLRA